MDPKARVQAAANRKLGTGCCWAYLLLKIAGRTAWNSGSTSSERITRNPFGKTIGCQRDSLARVCQQVQFSKLGHGSVHEFTGGNEILEVTIPKKFVEGSDIDTTDRPD
jgi:hypothetical protein